jgi:hypothetical protein
MTSLRQSAATLARITGRTRPAQTIAPADAGRGKPARTHDLQIAAVALGALTRPSGW